MTRRAAEAQRACSICLGRLWKSSVAFAAAPVLFRERDGAATTAYGACASADPRSAAKRSATAACAGGQQAPRWLISVRASCEETHVTATYSGCGLARMERADRWAGGRAGRGSPSKGRTATTCSEERAEKVTSERMRGRPSLAARTAASPRPPRRNQVRALQAAWRRAVRGNPSQRRRHAAGGCLRQPACGVRTWTACGSALCGTRAEVMTDSMPFKPSAETPAEGSAAASVACAHSRGGGGGLR